MRRRLFIMVLAALSAAYALCLGCTYSDGREESVETAKPPPDPAALTTREDDSPKYASKAEIGPDMRYILSYRGREVHIFAGESGLLGVKVIAESGETTWDSLWLTFSPTRVRPRKHSEDEIASEGEVNLEFVPEELRGYVKDAQQLALYLAPQAPITGEEAASPPGARSVIREVKLSPVTANELAIFGRTDHLAVTQNLKLPARDIPAKIKSGGNIKLDRSVSGVTYVPAGTWLSFKLVTRKTQTVFLTMRNRAGDYITYVEVHRRQQDLSKVLLEQLIEHNAGIISATYYEPVSGDPQELAQDVRAAAGITRTVLDEDLLEPPANFKHELIATTTVLVDRERVNDFEVQREGPRGIEPILREFESG